MAASTSSLLGAFILLLLQCLLLAAQTTICPESDYIMGPSGEHCYRYFQSPQTFAAAQEVCERDVETIEGTLVIIGSQDEDDFVNNELFVEFGETEFWIGLNDQDEEGIFRWVDGTTADALFLNWSPVFPNDNTASHDCVKYAADGWRVHDDGCEVSTLPFVCEVESFSTSGSGSGSGSGSDCLIEGEDYFPFLYPLNPRYVPNYDDGVAGPIFIPGGLPFGDKTHNTAYISTNGVISFERPFYFWYNHLFPGYPSIRYSYVVAPFWSDYDIRAKGRISYEVVEKVDEQSFSLLYFVSEFISKQTGQEFDGRWMLSVIWEDAPQYPHYYLQTYSYYYSSDYARRIEEETNTFQAIIITDHVKTYAVFTYQCGLLRSPGNWRYATIGFNANGLYYSNHDFSGRSFANEIACANTPCHWNNIVYQLNLGEDVVQREISKCLKLYDNDKLTFDVFFPGFTTNRAAEPCPCTFQQAWRDWGRFRWDYPDYYCFYQRFPTSDGGSQYCCYTVYSRGSPWGSLVTSGLRVSSSILFHPRLFRDLYQQNDRNFREACCGIAGLCDLYLKQRTPNYCTGYTPPVWTWGWGDPHITTLDGRVYTFNGWGEYLLAQWSSNITLFYLQARTDRVPDTQATQFVAFAFEEGSDRIQVSDCGVNGSCTVLHNGGDITGNLTNINDTFSDLFVEVTRDTDDNIVTSFSSGAVVSISVAAGGIPNFVLTLPQSAGGQLEGLLGDYDGDDTNEFVFRNGTMLSNDASDREIHEFGKSWQIFFFESLFVYPPGTNSTTYARDDDWEPLFPDEITVPDNITEFCNNDPQCIFDYDQTGDPEVGMGTMMTNQGNLEDQAQSSNFPPQFSGTPVFEVNIGEESVYNFALTDDRDDSIEVNIEGGFIEYELTLVPNSNNFTYTVTLVDTTNMSNISTLIFSANDSMSAVGVLSPRLEICACQNGGNCTQEGILGTVNNVVVLQCTCPGAYDGDFCENDADGCLEISCADGVECEDNPAPEEGATCPCPEGFNTTTDGRCIDIDECFSGGAGCSQVCTNTEGSFECSCWPGYRAVDEANCEDIDECAQGTDGCHQICENLEGSFQCNCSVGLELDVDDMTCIVPEGAECPPIIDLCSHMCVVINGASTCYCDRGYDLDNDGISCKDINECDRFPDICDQTCINSEGSYNCTCSSGYYLDMDDDRSCIDLDECSLAVTCDLSETLLIVLGVEDECSLVDETDGSCREGFVCSNTPGSFVCVCPAGTIPILLSNGSMMECRVPVVAEEGVENAVVATLSGVTVEEFLESGGLNDFITVTRGLIDDYCSQQQCRYINGSGQQTEVDIADSTVNVIVNTDTIQTDEVGNLQFDFYIEIMEGDQVYFLYKDDTLSAVEAGDSQYETVFGTAPSFSLLNPDPTVPPDDKEGGLDITLLIGAIVGAIAAGIIFILTLALIFYCIRKCCSSKTGKVMVDQQLSDKGGVKTDEISLISSTPTAPPPVTAWTAPPPQQIIPEKADYPDDRV